MKSRDVITRLQDNGWLKVRQSGSHIQLRNPTIPGTVTVPHPKTDLGIGTIKSIEKQSGIILRK